MDADQLVFDRVEVAAVRRQESRAESVLFAVEVRNAGEGPSESLTVPAEATATGLAMLTSVGTHASVVENWIAANVRRTANSHPNDGGKLRALVGKSPLLYDSRYVLD